MAQLDEIKLLVQALYGFLTIDITVLLYMLWRIERKLNQITKREQ